MPRPRQDPPPAAPKPRSFGRVVRDILLERDIYQTALGAPNFQALLKDIPDVSYESGRKALTGDRHPSSAIMQAFADHLGLNPDIFYEYRLNALRDQLDPAIVGTDAAYAELRRIEELSVTERAKTNGDEA